MEKHEGWWWPVASLGLYIAVTLAFSLPALLDLTTLVIGQGGDPWQTMWRFEEHESRISQVEFWQEFFGGGEPRLVNYSTLPWLPIQFVFGQPLAYNLVWLISSTLSGFCMYVLVRYLLRISNIEFRIWNIEFAALISGLYYMLWPYHLAHALGHFGAMQLQWLPLAILLFLKFTQKPTASRAAGLAIVTAIQAWSEHHYALWLILFICLYTAFNYQRIQVLALPKSRWHLALLVGLLIVLVILPYTPTVRLAATTDSPLELGAAQTIRFSADLFSYVTPASFHPVWGRLAEKLSGQHFTGNLAEATHYLGVVALLLIIFFRHKIPARDYYFWVSVAVVFMLISLGPRLHIVGRVLPIPLPYALIDSWPVFSSIRTVGRASVMIGLSLAVVLGWVLATQVRRPLFGIIAAFLIVADFLPPIVSLQSYAVSPAYARAGEWPGSRVVELPAATNYAVASRALYTSHIHGKEVVGNIALERAEDEVILQEVRSIPALRQLLYLRTGQLRLDRPDFFNQPLPDTLAETLTWFDVGGIIIHRNSLSPLQFAALHNFLVEDVGLLAEELGDIVLYPIPSELASRGDGVFLARDRRWTGVGFDEKRGSVFGEIPTEVGLSLYNTRDITQSVRLRFTIAPESHGNLLFIADGQAQELAGKPGQTLEVTVEVAPLAKETYVLRNQLPEKIIIQNPAMEAGPAF